MQLARRLLPYSLFSLAVLAAVYFALPRLITSLLNPQLSANLPFGAAELNIIEIGPRRVVASCSFGSETEEALRLSKVIVNYSPAGLLHKKVESIVLDSGYVNLGRRDGVVELPGFRRAAAPHDNHSKNAALLPFAADKIEIHRLHISFATDHTSPFALLVNAELTPVVHEESDGFLLSGLAATLQTTGNLNSTTDLRLASNGDTQTVSVNANIDNLASLKDFLRDKGISAIEGAVKIDGKLHLENLAGITGYKGNVSFPDFSLQAEEAGLQSTPASPLRLTFSGTMQQLHATVTNASISGAQPANINGELTYAFADGNFVAEGDIAPALLQTPLTFSAQGQTSPATTQLTYSIAGRQVTADHFSAESLMINGSATFDDGNLNTKSELTITRFKAPGQKVGVNEIHAQIPLSLESGSMLISQPATLEIRGAKRAELNLGDFTTTATLAKKIATFKTDAALALHPGLQLACNGKAHLNGELNLDCNLPETEINSTLFAAGIPFPADSGFTGKVNGTLKLNVHKGLPSGSARIGLANGQLTSGANVVSGIKGAIEFPHLPILESAPSQVVTIDAISAGKIQFTNGTVAFRLEDPGSVFIEKSRFSWCSGKVESGGLRLLSTNPALHTTLYCDRLDMAELLAQFGLVDTEGDGSLNGRLPVTISKNSMDIEDGFLFSTPGDSGIVHFNNTQQIKAGLPDMGQAAYLDYAVKSLENFSYNWTKLTFNKEHDDLLVTLQLDGAPAEPLPFGYKNGNIVKTDTGKGIQHPIRLDVNFRFPIKDLLRYGKNVQSIMENM